MEEGEREKEREREITQTERTLLIPGLWFGTDHSEQEQEQGRGAPSLLRAPGTPLQMQVFPLSLLYHILTNWQDKHGITTLDWLQ